MRRGRRDEAAVRAGEERLALARDAAGLGWWDRDLASGRVVWSAATSPTRSSSGCSGPAGRHAG
jgi:hypothetical protein